MRKTKLSPTDFFFAFPLRRYTNELDTEEEEADIRTIENESDAEEAERQKQCQDMVDRFQKVMPLVSDYVCTISQKNSTDRKHLLIKNILLKRNSSN